MGNQQSNERKRNYKIYKITWVSKHSDWIRCYLDDYVLYSDSACEHMDFETDSVLNFLEAGATLFGDTNSRRQATLIEGWHIAIDIDETKKHSSSYNFSRRSVVNVNVGNSSLAGEGGFQENIREIGEAREMLARANEWSDFDKQAQRAWQLQPPKK